MRITALTMFKSQNQAKHQILHKIRMFKTIIIAQVQHSLLNISNKRDIKDQGRLK